MRFFFFLLFYLCIGASVSAQTKVWELGVVLSAERIKNPGWVNDLLPENRFTYCEPNGYQRTGIGPNLHLNADSLLFGGSSKWKASADLRYIWNLNTKIAARQLADGTLRNLKVNNSELSSRLSFGRGFSLGMLALEVTTFASFHFNQLRLSIDDEKFSANRWDPGYGVQVRAKLNLLQSKSTPGIWAGLGYTINYYWIGGTRVVGGSVTIPLKKF